MKTFTVLESIDELCVFVQVCELDIIFNFEKAYFILDEFLMGGEIQDTSKKSVLKAIEQADLLQEVILASGASCHIHQRELGFAFSASLYVYQLVGYQKIMERISVISARKLFNGTVLTPPAIER